MHKKFNISTADSKREKKKKNYFTLLDPPTFTLIYTEDELHLYKS